MAEGVRVSYKSTPLRSAFFPQKDNKSAMIGIALKIIRFMGPPEMQVEIYHI